MYLRRGEEVTRDYEMIARYGDRVPTRLVAGVELVEHTTVLGKRQALAGVERMLTGLSPGSFREAMIPPHLAYRDKGVKNLIPPNAMLRVQVWVHAVEAEDWRTRELR